MKLELLTCAVCLISCRLWCRIFELAEFTSFRFRRHKHIALKCTGNTISRLEKQKEFSREV